MIGLAFQVLGNDHRQHLRAQIVVVDYDPSALHENDYGLLYCESHMKHNNAAYGTTSAMDKLQIRKKAIKT